MKIKKLFIILTILFVSRIVPADNINILDGWIHLGDETHPNHGPYGGDEALGISWSTTFNLNYVPADVILHIDVFDVNIDNPIYINNNFFSNIPKYQPGGPVSREMPIPKEFLQQGPNTIKFESRHTGSAAGYDDLGVGNLVLTFNPIPIINTRHSEPSIDDKTIGDNSLQFTRGDTVRVSLNINNAGEGVYARIVLNVKDSSGNIFYDSHDIWNDIVLNCIGEQTVAFSFKIPESASLGWCRIGASVRNGNTGGFNIIYDTTGPGIAEEDTSENAWLTAFQITDVYQGIKYYNATGHYYEVVLSPGITWTEARIAAEKREHLGRYGHLATVTSASENEFIANLINNPLYWHQAPTSYLGPILGGFQPEGSTEPGGGWSWVTGEVWDFTKWLPPSPTNALGVENYLHYFNSPSVPNNTWNDCPNDYSIHGVAYKHPSYVVEYELERRKYEPSNEPPILDSLAKWDTLTSTFVPITVGEITSNEIHILVHGWLPGWEDEVSEGIIEHIWETDIDDEGNTGYKDILESLAMAIHSKNPEGTVLVYDWIEGSATGLDPLFAQIAPEARLSRSNTDSSGYRMAQDLIHACNLYQQPDREIHFLGHSHGSRVSLKAEEYLRSKNINVAHITLLDSPERWGFIHYLNGAENQLDNLLVNIPSETFIDNYFSLFGKAYGGNIVDVKLHPDGEFYDYFYNHNYPMPWYVRATNSESNDIGLSWSPLIGGGDLDLENYYEQDWETLPGLFDTLRELVLKTKTDDFIGRDNRKKFPWGYFSTITEGMVQETGTEILLTEASSAYWNAIFKKGKYDSSLEFSYKFDNYGDGDQLGIWIDDEMRFVMTGLLCGLDICNSEIPIGDLSEGNHAICIALHSKGEKNAKLRVSNISITATIRSNGDFKCDGMVDYEDFAQLSEAWFAANHILDIAPFPDGDGVVDIKELLILSDNWLNQR